jgi:hypothetical protein
MECIDMIDRELDLAISVAINFRNVFGGDYEWRWGAGGDEIEGHRGGKRIAFLDPRQFVPRWTGSIDAAFLVEIERLRAALRRIADGNRVARAISIRSFLVKEMTTMDYRALLLKYINHVGECEGVTFIADHHRRPDLFTDEEWAELCRLDDDGRDFD